MPIVVGGVKFEIPCIVSPKLNKSVIIGNDWLIETGSVLDFGKIVLIVEESEGRKVIVKFKLEHTDERSLSVNLVEEEGRERHQQNYTELRQAAWNAETFDEHQRELLYRLLKENRKVLSEYPGNTGIYQHKIEMKDKKPFYKAAYPVPLAYREQFRE